MYIDNYEAYENKHIHYTEAHYSAKDNRYGKTEATCTTPPTVIYNKEEIKLHLTIEISGTRGSDTVHVRPEDPEINYGSTTGRGKFATKDDKHSLDVYIDDSVKRYEDDVYGTLPDGSAGDRIALFFCGCGADTKWIYEYKLVE